MIPASETEISRRDFVKLSTAALAAPALLTACGGDEPEEGQAGGPVRFLSAENFWADWDPYQANALSQFRLNKQVYDFLLDFPDGDLTKPAPMLATEWEQRDPRTWEFTLREGVRFHDGSRFTAEDVKASIERASGATDVKTVHAGSWVPTTVEVVDELTVRLRTEKPFGPLFAALFNTQIVAAADLEGDPKKLKAQPNGTGPWKLVRDQPTRKVMEANPRYWAGPPSIREMVWEFIQDPQTRLSALLAGQAHAIDRVPPEHLERITDSDELALTSVTGIENVNLWWRPGRYELRDKRREFREAVAWSIDRKALVDNLVLGKSRVAESFLPSNALFFEAQSPAYGFDPGRARSLLEAAGAADGGPEFELWVASGFLPRAEQIVEAIVAGMREVGLRPKVVTSDVAGMVDDIFSDKGSGAAYHLSWASSGDPNAVLAQVIGPGGVWSDEDKKVNDLLTSGAAETDAEARAPLYAELQRHLWRTIPHIPLYYSDFTIGHTKRLKGLRVLPNQFETYFYPASVSA
jgi:peptide/nickel transport system substrate-binding protein